MFLNIQIDLIISKTDYEKFTLTTKNHCISPLTADFTEISSEAVLRMKAVLLSQQPHHTTTVLRPIFQDHKGEPVPEENFWTLWCKGRLTEADTPNIRLGATPSGLIGAHLHHLPIFCRSDALPATQPTVSKH